VTAIDEGGECARDAPLLPALAPADAVVALRAHLRACGA